MVVGEDQRENCGISAGYIIYQSVYLLFKIIIYLAFLSLFIFSFLIISWLKSMQEAMIEKVHAKGGSLREAKS